MYIDLEAIEREPQMRTTKAQDDQITVEDTLKKLHKILGYNVYVLVADEARYYPNDYSDKSPLRFAKVKINATTFNAPSLSECVRQVRLWHKAQELNTVLLGEQQK